MKHFRLLLTIFYFFLISILYAQESDVRIIPQPAELTMVQEQFHIAENLKIYANDISLYRLIDYTITNLKKDFGITAITSSNPKDNNAIRLLLDDSFKNKTTGAYVLEVNEEGVTIVSATAQGLFYGVQSFRQLAGLNESSKTIPGILIHDEPRFPWRAFMLDEGRYFKGKSQVLKLLDEMARLKMNIFHWHLVDDQGWRIEIKKYPLLTEIGSVRPTTQVGPLKWKSPIQSGEKHEGFYRQDEIREIVEYADDLFITVMPEIEMPGHSTAAIAAYPWLGSFGQNIEIPITFGVGLDVYNVTDPKVYNFLTGVLDEVIALFPSKVIHIGGDEVKYDHWKNSEKIQQYMQDKGLATPADLQIFFTNQISQYIESKGRRMMGWNEIMGHNLHEYQSKEDTEIKEKLAPTSVIHFWKGDIQLVKAAAEGGFDLVNSLHTNTYLDYSYQDISLEKAYNFDPIPNGLSKKYHHKVLGTGCQMWGEWIPTAGYMDFQVFPRIAAYAEVGWTTKKQKDFSGFIVALQRILNIWKQEEIYYAPLEWALPEKQKN